MASEERRTNRGYPRTAIIGWDGKMTYISGIEPKDLTAFMQEMNELAKFNGIAWPPTENMPASERDR